MLKKAKAEADTFAKASVPEEAKEENHVRLVAIRLSLLARREMMFAIRLSPLAGKILKLEELNGKIVRSKQQFVFQFQNISC